jgi:predicted Rossmann fold flavoprotein
MQLSYTPNLEGFIPVQSTDQLFDLVVVGGGAAGFFAAITCAELAAQTGNALARILILEKASRPLGKVLISGGGRCNLTHACYDPAQLVRYYPRGSAELRSAFARFQPRDTVAWFERRGVALRTEMDGCIFPVSDSSHSIVDCLLQAAQHAGVSLWERSAVAAIENISKAPPDDGSAPRFLIRLRPGNQPEQGTRSETLFARHILLATGGDKASMNLAAALGQAIEPPVPSLFTFTISDPRLDGLAGITLPAVSLRLIAEDGTPARIPGLEQQGALLITHWGLSGPAVLQLSAWGARWLYDRAYRAALAINWLYPLTRDQALFDLQAYKKPVENARQKVANHAPFRHLPQRLWKRLVQACEISETHNWGDLSKAALGRLADELTCGRYAIQGKGPFKDEFVTCGGIRLDTLDFKTMQSRRIPGLYFAGEVLDVDGMTGGFNLQNAWTTGWIAGSAIAKAIGPSH